MGGYVRDSIQGEECQDLDLVVESEGGAEALCRFLSKNYPEDFSQPHLLGKNYPIWQIVYQKTLDIEVADTHSEMFPDPLSRQRVIRYGTLEEDCRRRDFTINMLYLRALDSQLLDPSGCGLASLKARILRCHPSVDPEKIFSDDPLRILRLFRFKARWAFEVGEGVLRAAQSTISRLEVLSPERIRDEIIKTIPSGRLGPFFEDLRLIGAWEKLFPELLPMPLCEQDKIYHSEGNVWVHTLAVMQKSSPTVVGQLAALLHDVGKPAVATRVGDRIKFLEHEKFGEEMAEKFLRRFKFERDVVDKVKKLVRLHLRGGDAENWKHSKAARKFLRDAGDDLEDLLNLIEADSLSSLDSQGRPRISHLVLLRAALKEAQKVPLKKEDLISGTELMEKFKLPPGAHIKALKAAIQEFQDEAAAVGKVLSPEEALELIAPQIKRLSY